MIVRHPSLFDRRNAFNKGRWYQRFLGGVHCADLRSVDLYRTGEWLALQSHWRLVALMKAGKHVSQQKKKRKGKAA